MTDDRDPGPSLADLDTPFLREARARLAAIPPGALRPSPDLPPWPKGVPEIIGPLRPPYGYEDDGEVDGDARGDAR